MNQDLDNCMVEIEDICSETNQIISLVRVLLFN